MKRLAFLKIPFLLLGWVGPFLFLIWFLFSLEAAELPFQEVSLETESGEKFSGLIAGPEDAKAGILLVHDWFGVSPFYKETMERLAGEGYRVLAIDYYGGKKATNHRRALTLMQKVKPERVAEKVRAGIAALKAEDRKVVTFGFSLGTEYAYRAALNNPDVFGVVLWYGWTPTTPEDVKGMDAVVFVVLGSLDGPADKKGALYLKLMEDAGKGGALYIYPGGHHAFAQPLFNGGRTYDPKGAEKAWKLTKNFLGLILNENQESSSEP